MMKKLNIKRTFIKVMPPQFIKASYAFKYFFKKLPSAKIYKEILKGKSGIEIGGPSIFFKYIVPIYPVVEGLDCVNFSNKTMWEGSLESGNSFTYYKNKTGLQYIAEAADLGTIKSNAYDFLLSSNCLEHVANPLKALEEWSRVITPGGYLLLVLPNKSNNFDHRRPTTTFDHILEDYTNNMSEHDLTHLDEIFELHDLSRDVPAGDLVSFKKRSLDNFSNRGLHHHVFDLPLILRMFDFIKISIIQSDITTSDYVVIGKVNK